MGSVRVCNGGDGFVGAKEGGEGVYVVQGGIRAGLEEGGAGGKERGRCFRDVGVGVGW